MKFAHLADCHIGGWREPILKEASIKAFIEAIDLCLERNVDFVLMSGDLFNTSLPPIEIEKVVFKKLRELKERGVAVYIIAGSHDFSPSGKTKIEVLEEAGFVKNVVRGFIDDKKRLNLYFTIDKKTGAKITGMLGRKGMLEKKYYESLNLEPLEKERGYKIFMFHTAINELKTEGMEHMDSTSISLLPRNFNYYAGGHIHEIIKTQIEGYGIIAYPGALFPNNFKELEKFGFGGFYIVEEDKVEFIPVKIYETITIKIDCNNKKPAEIESLVVKEITNKDFKGKIVTLRLYGILKEGKPLDIDFKELVYKIKEKGAVEVLKNIYALTSKQFEVIRISGSLENIEEKIIEENLCQLGIEKSELFSLLSVLAEERGDAERTLDFEKRVYEEVTKILKLD
ncbi:MAG: DNA repair exonuclease [Candidatus Woesearchaeota archaeon]